MAGQLSGTLSNFITRIRRWIREEDPTISYWSDDFIKQVFNSRYRLRCTELFMAHEGYFTIIGTRDLISEQSRYAWPSGFSRLLKMELIRSDGRRVPIQRQERWYEVLETGSAAGDNYIPSWRPVGSGFVLEPAPIETVVDGIHLEWNGVPDELTDDGDSLQADYPQEYTEFLVLDTAVALFDAEGNQESGQLTTLLRQRQEWEDRWERYIDGRMTSLQSVTPFITHYDSA